MMAIVQNEDILHWKWKGQREKCSGTQVRIVLRNSTAICVFDHAAQRRRPGDASRRQPDLTTVLSLVPLLTVTFALFTAFPIFGAFERALRDFLTDQLMPEQVNAQIFETL